MPFVPWIKGCSLYFIPTKALAKIIQNGSYQSGGSELINNGLQWNDNFLIILLVNLICSYLKNNYLTGGITAQLANLTNLEILQELLLSLPPCVRARVWLIRTLLIIVNHILEYYLCSPTISFLDLYQLDLLIFLNWSTCEFSFKTFISICDWLLLRSWLS